MPADPSIYNLLKPIQLPESNDLVGKMGAAFQQGSKIKGQMKEVADKEAMQTAYNRNMGDDGKLNRAGYMNDLARIDPDKAMAYGEKFKAMDASDLAAKSAALDTQINQMGYIANLAGSAKDQPSYDGVLAKATELGFGDAVAKMPKQYDPGLMKNYAYNSMKQGERLAAERAELEKQKEAFDQKYKGAQLAQSDRHKEAEITGNANLATVRGRQRIDQITAQAEEERKTKGVVSADTQARLADANGIGGAGKFTAGQKAVDQDFAKDYNAWTSGEAKNARTEIEKLRSVAKQLTDGKVETGGVTGMFPDRMTTNATLSTRSDVHSTIMNSMKATLGSAFTEKEGERKIKATWNEADSTENNLARVNRLIGDLSAKADDNDSKANHYETYGTLANYKAGPSAATQQKKTEKPPEGLIGSAIADERGSVKPKQKSFAPDPRDDAAMNALKAMDPSSPQAFKLRSILKGKGLLK